MNALRHMKIPRFVYSCIFVGVILTTSLPNLFISKSISNLAYIFLNQSGETGVDKTYVLPYLLDEESWGNSNATQISNLLVLYKLTDWGRQITPAYPQWDLLEGQYWLRLGDFHKATELFKNVLSVPDDNYLPIFFLGLAYEFTGDHTNAVQIWHNMPESGFYFLLNGKDLLEKHGNIELAIKYLEIATDLLPQSCEALYYQGLALNQMDRAKPSLLLWLDINNQACYDVYYLGELYYERGKLLQSLGRPNEALDDYRIALFYESQNIKRIVRLANLLAENGDSDESESLYRKVIEIDPNEMWGYLGMCNLERLNNQYLNALKWCQDTLTRFPNNAVAYYYTGRLNQDMGEVQEAISWFERAVSHGVPTEQMWLHLGDAYQGIGNDERALYSYQKTLEFNPSNTFVQQKINELRN